MSAYQLESGDRIHLEPRPLGRPGGEGTVYKVVGHHETVAKILHAHKRTAEMHAKLQAMVANKPGGRSTTDQKTGRSVPVIAWPEHLVLENGRMCGFLMQGVDRSQAVEISTVENKSARETRVWTKGLGLGKRAIIARNLSFLVKQIHRVDSVIGDFNERNTLVSQQLIVTIIDCDSMQVSDPSGRRHLCTVFQSGFIAPELVGKDLSRTVRATSSDLFTLAVHIYMLLLDGRHPFRNGRYTGPGDKPKADLLSQQGQWRGRNGGVLRVEDGQLDPRVFLPPSMLELFERAFQRASQPQGRPTAVEWERELAGFIGDWKPAR